MPLSDEQVERYSRQILLPEIGGRGQERLLQSSVAVLGSGLVAWTATSYLVGAGVGRVEVAENDGDAAPAVHDLTDEIADLNPGVRLQVTGWPGSRGAEWARRYDLVVGACDADSLAPIVEAAERARRPVAAGGAFGRMGWFCIAGGSASQEGCVLCARRAAQADAPTEDDSPLAAVTGTVVGSLIAIEVTKRLLGMATPDGWFSYDAQQATLARRSLSKQPGCPACRAEVGS